MEGRPRARLRLRPRAQLGPDGISAGRRRVVSDARRAARPARHRRGGLHRRALLPELLLQEARAGLSHSHLHLRYVPFGLSEQLGESFSYGHPSNAILLQPPPWRQASHQPSPGSSSKSASSAPSPPGASSSSSKASPPSSSPSSPGAPSPTPPKQRTTSPSARKRSPASASAAKQQPPPHHHPLHPYPQ